MLVPISARPAARGSARSVRWWNCRGAAPAGSRRPVRLRSASPAPCQLHAPLVEGVDVPDHALHEHAVLVKRHQRTQRVRSELPRQDRSEEHTSELQSLMRISYAVFCLTKKKTKTLTKH